MNEKFEMVAKTLKGLEDVLAEELRAMGAENVMPGLRMVSFEGDLAMLYRANYRCRTALSILKPFYKFIASDTDSLYAMVKEYDWGKVLKLDSTFSIDTTTHSQEFTHSRYATYRVKDAIVDWFQDRFGADKRPGVRLKDADVNLNLHIDGERITLSLNSSGESLYRRGWRVEQTEAPINEVLAAGIILKSGWRGDCPLVDPMCGSGTFLVEAALIAANIQPGAFRKEFAFERWKDFDAELFESVIAETKPNMDVACQIFGADISPRAISIAGKNVLSAGVDELVSLRVRPLAAWEEAPADGKPGVLITNPPYGERLALQESEQLYSLLGTKLKRVFTGYHAWVISSNFEGLSAIALSPSSKTEMKNGGLDCELREYIMFEGTKSEFRKGGGGLKAKKDPDDRKEKKMRRKTDSEWQRDARDAGHGGERAKVNRLAEKYRPKKGGYAKSEERRRKYKEETAALGEAEEKLSRRRNERLLREIEEGPMKSKFFSQSTQPRLRKRWKKPGNDTPDNNTDTNNNPE